MPGCIRPGVAPHEIAVGPGISSRTIQAASTRWRHGELALGYVYVLLSLLVGLWYLRLLAPSLANVLFWPGFNQTGYQAYLVDIANAALVSATPTSPALDLLTAYTMPKTYTSRELTTTYYASYARRLVFTELVSLEYIVPVLRNISVAAAKGVEMQQCWVDFNRSWEVAHTDARQARCATKYATNAAAYYESVLRNIDFAAFLATFGGPGNEFTVAIQLALQASPEGVAWLASVATADTTVAEEIAYWRRHGLVEYRSLWAN
ncbi:hypothetical protein ACHHYP_06472, partial [Achlya hypogyna]